jgi:hypothetical protein
MKKAMPWIAAAAVVAAAVAAYIFYLRGPAPEPAPQAAVEKPPAPAPQPTVVRPTAEPPLPGLDESDAAVKEWLYGVVGREAVERFLVPDSLVRKLVATVDNLPRKKLDPRVRAVRGPEGSFQAETTGEEIFLGPGNYSRYEPLMQVVRVVDPAKVADLYVRIYPLLQQAYEELGYPGRQFHVRALEAIDDLLATPQIEKPIRLARPHVFFEFADARLEARSAGQKTLLRMGPEHSALIKEKLTAFRAAIVARSTTRSGG